jgi:hypothetical protein
LLKLSLNVNECKPLLAGQLIETSGTMSGGGNKPKVGRCSLTLSKPVLNAPMVSAISA